MVIRQANCPVTYFSRSTFPFIGSKLRVLLPPYLLYLTSCCPRKPLHIHHHTFTPDLRQTSRVQPNLTMADHQAQVPIQQPDNRPSTAAETEGKYNSLDTGAHHENATGDQPTSQKDREFYEKYGTYDRYEITEEDCYEELGFCFPNWKKWTILSIVFTVQVSMNFNTSLYSNAIGGISEEFHVSAQAGRLGAAIFLITYAFGCELWAVRLPHMIGTEFWG